MSSRGSSTSLSGCALTSAANASARLGKRDFPERILEQSTVCQRMHTSQHGCAHISAATAIVRHQGRNHISAATVLVRHEQRDPSDKMQPEEARQKYVLV